MCGSGGKMAAPTRFVSPNAEVVSKTQALMVNVAAARGLQNVLKTNLGENANWLCFCRVHFEIKPVLSYWLGLRTSSDLWIYFERRAGPSATSLFPWRAGTHLPSRMPDAMNPAEH